MDAVQFSYTFSTHIGYHHCMLLHNQLLNAASGLKVQNGFVWMKNEAGFVCANVACAKDFLAKHL
jgi:bifunctional pyridoxal-dependent enzyme with beta-cystathionase and maltose regulon repressor activities